MLMHAKISLRHSVHNLCHDKCGVIFSVIKATFNYCDDILVMEWSYVNKPTSFLGPRLLLQWRGRRRRAALHKVYTFANDPKSILE